MQFFCETIASPIRIVYYLQEEIIFLLLILCVFYSNLIDYNQNIPDTPLHGKFAFSPPPPYIWTYFICFLKGSKNKSMSS